MYHLAKIIIFSCLWPLWVIVALSGCGENIPPASDLASGKVTLAWHEVPGAISYNVYGSTSPGVTKLSGSKFRNVPNPVAITQLQPGKTYYFVVTVVTDSGESKESKEMAYTADAYVEGNIQFGDIVSRAEQEDVAPESEDITTPSPSKSAPEVSSEQPGRQPAPTRSANEKAKLTVKDAPPKTVDVTLSWDNVPKANSYNIYWSDKPGVTKKNGTKISNANNPHKIEGLERGKRYYFVVTAVNVSGESKESEEMSFTAGE